MRRGTTPTITATVDADLTGMAVHLAFKVGGNGYVGTLTIKQTA